MDRILEFTSGALLEVLPFGTPGKICPRHPPPVLFMCQVCSSGRAGDMLQRFQWHAPEREECLLASSKGKEHLSVFSIGVQPWSGWMDRLGRGASLGEQSGKKEEREL